MVTCVAYGCTNRSGKSGATFHSFPKDNALRRLWIKALRRKDWEPTKSSKICSDHFREADIDRTSLLCVRIRDGAVPCIFSFPTRMQNIHLYTFLGQDELKNFEHCPTYVYQVFSYTGEMFAKSQQRYGECVCQGSTFSRIQSGYLIEGEHQELNRKLKDYGKMNSTLTTVKEFHMREIFEKISPNSFHETEV
ncbi:uncharacterized protein LOC126101254 [Schistocerca cancellata]|uniref:uncharacterized protein LOC126101254 n=1 Tax=Schistocerca cancellata TaxID=274614 RepID=UPI0021177DFF|nr:uncharacterized protein LOC126101254 [Schistocerca cancellata]